MPIPMPAAPDHLFDDAQRLRFDQPDEARARIEEAACLCRAAGNQDGLGRALAWLGQLDRDAGDGAAAAARYEAAAAIARDVGDTLLLAHRLRHAGDVRLEADDVDGAAPLIEEALALYREGGSGPLDRANMLRSAALLREQQGRPTDASALWAKAAELYAEAGIDAGVAECRRRSG